MQRRALMVAAAAAALLLSRAPAMAGDQATNDASSMHQQTTGGMENPDPGIAPANPTDEAPAMVVPGSATPGTDMKSGEIEATGKPSTETDVIDTTPKTGTGSDELEATGTHGGARDATGGYDAPNSIQSDEDVEANAGSTFDSELQQKNLQQAMEPKNARRSGNGAASRGNTNTHSGDMPD